MRWYEVESNIKEERTLWFSHVTEDQLFMQNPLTYRAAWACALTKSSVVSGSVADERPAQDFRVQGILVGEEIGSHFRAAHKGTSNLAE